MVCHLGGGRRSIGRLVLVERTLPLPHLEATHQPREKGALLAVPMAAEVATPVVVAQEVDNVSSKLLFKVLGLSNFGVLDGLRVDERLGHLGR